MRAPLSGSRPGDPPRTEDAGSAGAPLPPSGGRPGSAGGPRSLLRRGPLALFAISLLLLAAGVTLLVLASGTGSTPAAANQAFTNAAETRQVTAAVSGDVAGIFSYNYTDLAATTNEAHQVLSGQAAAQYAELSTMLQSAASEKLIVSTKVTAIGVRTLTSDSATLLVFLRQNSTRAGTSAGSAAAQVQITARLTGGRWLITGIAAPQD